MDSHLGYQSNDHGFKNTENRRNGYINKTIKSTFGDILGVWIGDSEEKHYWMQINVYDNLDKTNDLDSLRNTQLKILKEWFVERKDELAIEF